MQWLDYLQSWQQLGKIVFVRDGSEKLQEFAA
jgi:hypothetical protein